MTHPPTIQTERLVLRSFALSDAAPVAQLCAEKEIAATTLLIPHPYTLADAQKWISTHHELFDAGRGVQLAITLRENGELVGAVGLMIEREHDRAELGYWIGIPWWGKGYATEAGRAAVRYGFEGAGLNRVWAYHYMRNPASGRVLEKIGLGYEGPARQHVKKWGRYEDCPLYGVIRADYDAGRL